MAETSVRTQSLNENAAAVTTLGYFGVGCVYLSVLMLSLVFPTPWDNLFTIGLTACVTLLSWLGWFWLRSNPVAPGQAHLALTLLIAVMALQTGGVLYEIADPLHSGNQVMILLAAAFFLISRPWFYTSIALVIGCWLPAAFVGFQNETLRAEWSQWGRLLLICLALAVTFFEARRRTVLNTYSLKLAAEDALDDAQVANQQRLSMQDMMQASQRREALGVLAGGIAHDFNNLLAVISGNLELMRLQPNQASIDAEKMLDEMQKASDRATELTQQMLVYAGRSKPKVSNLLLGQRVRSAARLIESSVPPNVRIVLEGTSDGPQISVDTTLLDQLVFNLIQNATEACEKGGGIVRLNWYTTEMEQADLLTLSFAKQAQPGTYALLEVSDNGVGMDEQTQSKMFEPFFSTKSKGNGLGLAVATGILESHRAGVSVTSMPGEGCTMRLAIPVNA